MDTFEEITETDFNLLDELVNIYGDDPIIAELLPSTSATSIFDYQVNHVPVQTQLDELFDGFNWPIAYAPPPHVYAQPNVATVQPTSAQPIMDFNHPLQSNYAPVQLSYAPELKPSSMSSDVNRKVTGNFHYVFISFKYMNNTKI